MCRLLMSFVCLNFACTNAAIRQVCKVKARLRVSPGDSKHGSAMLQQGRVKSGESSQTLTRGNSYPITWMLSHAQVRLRRAGLLPMHTHTLSCSKG